ncbi:MAG TPA: uracil-DNA glycosylase [Thermomicrobiales bacterium]|nr:uracil-DNA glycosylase [Thermomicrobiales bacterium]
MMELPLYNSLEEVRQAALGCRACRRAETRRQVVFGAGNPNADLMLVGEAPSSTDDATGIPYSGPAGDVLDELLIEAGASREEVWITNLLRCYEGRERDGRPENQPARTSEIRACVRWLNLEIQYVSPRVIVAIGAPAARALISPDFRLTEQRGAIHTRPDGIKVIATTQPAYVMRLRNLADQDTADTERARLLDDLRRAVAAAR